MPTLSPARVLGANERVSMALIGCGGRGKLVTWHFIDPGKPVRSAFIESFIGRLQDECLSQHWFRDLLEARRIIEAWRCDYNQGPSQLVETSDSKGIQTSL